MVRMPTKTVVLVSPPLHPASARSQLTIDGAADGNMVLQIVGEAPGAEEDRLGKPFVGRSGELLDKILAAVDLNR